MTTLSNPLPNSLMTSRGSSRCAGADDASDACDHRVNVSVTASVGEDGSYVDGDIGVVNNPSNDDFVFEDEEIASIEADGIGSGPTENQHLTAALVTSIVESAGTTSTSRAHRCINNRKQAGKRSPRRKQKKQHHPKPMILGTELNPPSSSSVPNPLAAIHENAPLPLMHHVNSNNILVTGKTDTLMSAAPNVHQLGNQFSNIAQSMSSQNYQSDGLAAAASNNIGGGIDIMPQVRGRIFSIDLDPAVLDFVENVVDPLASDKSGGDTASEYANRISSVTFKDAPDGNAGRAPSYRDRGYSFERRERGYSFEFFSFGINEEEPLPPVAPESSFGGTHYMHSQGGTNRPRGDSIIFDPTSFREGGIHETSALMHIKEEGEGGGQQQRITERFPIAPLSSSQLAPPAPVALLPPITTSRGVTPIATSSRSFVTSIHGNVRSRPKQSKTSLSTSSRLHRQAMSSTPGQTSTVVSSRSIPPQAFSDTTIHMPHGSDAAAAAAAGMPQTSPASPHEGQHSLSHIDCPMELLNKGGRIGIYLPEERKARIAKFHSKRKIRIWRKRIKYDCRKKLADSRPRVKGRFVKRSDVD